MQTTRLKEDDGSRRRRVMTVCRSVTRIEPRTPARGSAHTRRRSLSQLPSSPSHTSRGSPRFSRSTSQSSNETRRPQRPATPSALERTRVRRSHLTAFIAERPPLPLARLRLSLETPSGAPIVRSETTANRCNHLIQRPFGLICCFFSCEIRRAGSFLAVGPSCTFPIERGSRRRKGEVGGTVGDERWLVGRGRTEMKDDTG